MTTTTVGAARAHYYRTNGFGDDGGDSLAWVPIKLWRFTIKIPNSNARRAAVKIHDVHHVVTGYQTDIRGESEIGAWELASGCARVPVAFVLNFFALALGILVAPRAVVRAWARGRHTRNLYGTNIDELLDSDLEQVRTSLHLDQVPPPARLRDVLGVSLLALPALAILLAVLAAPLVGLYYVATAL